MRMTAPAVRDLGLERPAMADLGLVAPWTKETHRCPLRCWWAPQQKICETPPPYWDDDYTGFEWIDTQTAI